MPITYLGESMKSPVCTKMAVVCTRAHLARQQNAQMALIAMISLDNRQKLQNVCSNAEQAPKHAGSHFSLVPVICSLL